MLGLGVPESLILLAVVVVLLLAVRVLGRSSTTPRAAVTVAVPAALQSHIPA